jgi:rare lipoprotein A
MTGPLLAMLAALFAQLGAPQSEPETGMASWYGYPYHGRQAASGEIYDMETLTAAHPTLPFQTRVRVINLENRKAVEVRIVDRGPFIEGRIIDMSHAAAKALGMIVPGTVPVRVEVIGSPEAPAAATAATGVAERAAPAAPADLFLVQAGCFEDRANAERLRALMQQRYGSARVVPRDGGPAQWRVWVGTGFPEAEARALSGRIRDESGGVNAAFIVRPGT